MFLKLRNNNIHLYCIIKLFKFSSASKSHLLAMFLNLSFALSVTFLKSVYFFVYYAVAARVLKIWGCSYKKIHLCVLKHQNNTCSAATGNTTVK